MRWEGFAERADRVGSVSGDYDKIEEVAALLREADETGAVARFVQGRVFPAWDDAKLDVGPALLYDALALASDEKAESVEQSVAKVGDVGDVAAELDLGGQMTFGEDEETVADVRTALRKIAGGAGEGSEETKTRELANLFMGSSPEGAKYLARLVLGEMRLGVGEGTVRDAVADAFDVDTALVERGLMVTNDIAEVAETARDEGDDGLAALEMRLGRPVKPMLAQTGGAPDALEEFDEAVVEWKYDGARLQVHVGDETRLFSRSLEDLTDSLPDVVETVEEDADEHVILDAEVVAVDGDEPLPFQEVLRRIRRKHRIDEMRDEVALELHVFDILYDGDDGAVIDEPLRDRYDRLNEAVDGTRARVRFVNGTDEVRRERREAVEAGHEGVMVKNPESAYTPGARGGDWLKLKPEPETLDLVVTGGEWGEGRRASLVGSYLLSARTDDGYKTVGKVATGLTDEQLESLTDRFEELVEAEDGKTLKFQPSVVIGVGYEEIQRSPDYTSGYALRFPRFVRVRDDKGVEDADAVEKIERLYERGEGDG
ncbi:MAG: ATP-dependent DNA ligase [Halobacteriales archaeon]